MAIVEYGSTASFVLVFDDQVAPARQLAQTLSQTIEGDFFSLRRFFLPEDRPGEPGWFQLHQTVVVFIDATSQSAIKAQFNLSDESAAKIIAVTGPGDACNMGFTVEPGSGRIFLNAFSATQQPLTPDYARFLFIAEMSELLMGFQTHFETTPDWNPSSS